jgi:tetratricopeptide (TPR) repeat protein
LESAERSPNDAYLLSKLSSTHYELYQYREALGIIKKALKVAPEEPLVLWHYAGSLDALNHDQEAINVYKKIIGKGAYRIAFIDTSEGIRWARSLMNDCRYRIGLCYRDMGNLSLGAKWIKQHLKNRRLGIPSIYSTARVKKKLTELLKPKK